jgi:hypothetical protein
MSVGPKLMISAGLACAGLGLIGAGAGATFTAQVSGTTTVTSGGVGLSLNGQTGSDVQLDVDAANLGSHFDSVTADLRLKNTGTLDLARSYLALTSPQCSPGDQGDPDGGNNALAHALHATVTDLTHHVTEYDGPFCSFAAHRDRSTDAPDDAQILEHAPTVGETIHYQLVLTPHDPVGGLPSAAQRSRATVRVTFTGLDY